MRTGIAPHLRTVVPLLVSVLACTAAEGEAAIRPVDGDGGPFDAAAEGATPEAGEAAVDPLINADPALDLGSDDDLLMFEDLPVVVSASRQRTPQHLTSTPVSVIDGEDLTHGIVTTLPQAFAFVPGVDSLQIDRNTSAIGVRGLHDTFSDRTLTLVDGRPADSPIFGGNTFYDLPISIADIERIEVVRGPGGAVWGANAFTGVINIITKEPHTTPGIYARTTGTQHEDAHAYLRWGESYGAWDLRISGAFDRIRSSSSALDDSDTSDDDYRYTRRADFDAAWHLGGSDTLRFGMAVNDRRYGTVDAFSSTNTGEARRKQSRAFARWEHTLETEGQVDVEYVFNRFEADEPALTKVTSVEQDFNVRIEPRAFEEHDVVFGANLRKITIDQEMPNRESFFFDDSSVDEYWAGAYALDRWTFADRWLLEIQGRVDHYSETTTDWSGRVGLLREVGEDRRHVARLAAARAFRAPLIVLRELRANRRFVTVTGLGEVPFVMFEPPAEEHEHETTWALEAGYHLRLTDRLTLRIDTYYQRFEDLIGTVSSSDALGRTTLTTANIDGADSYGVEIEVAWSDDQLETRAWYAFNSFEPDQEDQSLRAYEPAEHKAGTGLRWWFRDDMALDLNYQYVSQTPASAGIVSSDDADAFHRLDVNLGGRIPDTDGRWDLGVHDVFNETEVAISSGGVQTPHRTPGRSVIGRLSWEF